MTSSSFGTMSAGRPNSRPYQSFAAANSRTRTPAKRTSIAMGSPCHHDERVPLCSWRRARVCGVGKAAWLRRTVAAGLDVEAGGAAVVCLFGVHLGAACGAGELECHVDRMRGATRGPAPPRRVLGGGAVVECAFL